MYRLILFLCLSAASGCYYTQVTDGVISTRDVDFGKHHQIDSSRRITATDREHIILYFPTGVPSAQDAIDKAIDGAHGNRRVVGLANARVVSHSFWFYLYGQVWFTVEGCPIYELEDSPRRDSTAETVALPALPVMPGRDREPGKPTSSEKPKTELTDLPF